MPASFCGLYGIRPTHGRLPLDGMLPQAPSSDTTGWFARDGRTFARVSQEMLGEDLPQELPKKLVIAVDAFGFADNDVQAALKPMVSRLTRLIGPAREESMAPQGLSVWARAQRTLQPAEAWETFRPWIEAMNPRIAFVVARNLIAGSQISAADRGWAVSCGEKPALVSHISWRTAPFFACRQRPSRLRRKVKRSRHSIWCVTASHALPRMVVSPACRR